MCRVAVTGFLLPSLICTLFRFYCPRPAATWSLYTLPSDTPKIVQIRYTFSSFFFRCCLSSTKYILKFGQCTIFKSIDMDSAQMASVNVWFIFIARYDFGIMTNHSCCEKGITLNTWVTSSWHVIYEIFVETIISNRPALTLASIWELQLWKQIVVGQTENNSVHFCR